MERSERIPWPGERAAAGRCGNEIAQKSCDEGSWECYRKVMWNESEYNNRNMLIPRYGEDKWLLTVLAGKGRFVS